MSAYVEGILIQTGITLIAIVGVSLLTGFTGIFSMGHAGFMCIGAYTSALLCKLAGFPVGLGLICGMIAAMLVGFLIGLPTLKLRGDYFLIASIGIGEAIRLIVENTYSLTGGSTGMMDIGRVNSLPLVIILDIIVIVGAANFLRSKHGRNCIAIREDEIAATAMGINVYRHKLMVFAISCALCGLAGGLLGHYLNYVNPRVFAMKKSNELIMTVIMGGGGSLTGSIIAGLILTPLPELLRVEGAEAWRMAIYGILIVLVIMFRPNGLMGNKELTITGIKNFFRRSPRRLANTSEKGGKERDDG
ncbi:branched-chain amino acid ABC transporter permease [Christensenellaceae bacterium OttesenSCG-928-M15]|nr:branched-chain amino acid ABC transporter permease [Christensenellaceae bacterium OttesenSCG-928-M15]